MKFNPQGIYRALLAIACILAVVTLAAVGTTQRQWLARSLAGCFVCFALAAGGYPTLRKWAFTIWIATAVVVGMTYPTWFIGVGDFKFTTLFVPILQIIMFGMGTTLSVADFARVSEACRSVHRTGVPIHDHAVARIYAGPCIWFSPEIAAGLVLVGVSPSGLASNVMAYIAKANLALSVTMTAASTLLAPIITPLLMRLLAGELIEIDVAAMMWSITKIVVFPVLAGLVFHHQFYHRFKWLDRVMPLVSMVGIFVMTVLTVARA